MKSFQSMIVCMVVLLGFHSQAQIKVSGKILTVDFKPVPAYVTYGSRSVLTSEEGTFTLEVSHLPIEIEVKSLLGDFEHFHQTLADIHTQIFISLSNEVLEEVVVEKNRTKTTQLQSSDILQGYSGRFSEVLQQIPGIQSASIGSGPDRPIFRGLGLNRMVVSENGLRHEAQQWGNDHGLEVQTFQIDEVKWLMGVDAMVYGNENIGGVLLLRNDGIPAANDLNVIYQTFFSSMNNMWQQQLKSSMRNDRWYAKINASWSDYADLYVPSKEVRYLSYILPVHNNKLKNTAGKERSASVQVGFVDDIFSSKINASYFGSINGFFPGSHGVPNEDRLLHDGDYRNVDLPRQEAEHIKIQWSNELVLHSSHNLNFKTSFQKNTRKELSEFHTHYGDLASVNSEEEFVFDLKVLTAQLSLKSEFLNRTSTELGVEFQSWQNSVAGYSFFLPEYKRKQYGLYSTWKKELSDNWKMHLGLRADYNMLDVEGYYDAFLYDYIYGVTFDESVASSYANRGYELEQNNFSWNAAISLDWNSDNHTFQSSVSTVHRMPNAVELASNGMHHGAFRHEQGNPDLKKEQGLKWEVMYQWRSSLAQPTLRLYNYWIDNYIFLVPSGQFSLLPHAGQLYQYTQQATWHRGLELDNLFQLTNSLSFKTQFSWSLASIKDTKTAVPFSVPFRGVGKINYSFSDTTFSKSDINMLLESVLLGEQKHVYQNEKTTSGSVVWNMGIEGKSSMFNRCVTWKASLRNILNTRYLNHISFYRQLEIPEPGRSVQILIQIPII